MSVVNNGNSTINDNNQNNVVDNNIKQTNRQQSTNQLSYFSSSRIDDAVSGLSAGLIATLLFHPLELIKTRLQVQRSLISNINTTNLQSTTNNLTSSTSHNITPTTTSQPQPQPQPQLTRPYYNSYNVASSLIKNEGILSLYKGLTPNLLGNVSAWGLYFMLYNQMKNIILQYKYNNSSNTKQLTAIDHMISASLTGCTIQALTNPIWVVKTRMFLDVTPYIQQHIKNNTSNNISTIHSKHIYRSFSSSLSSIINNEGIIGLYKGFIPGLLGVSHGAFQFVAYEECKKYMDKLHENNSNNVKHKHIHAQSSFTLEYTPFETMIMAGISKTIAAVITYPYQVVRSRLQDYNSTYNGVIDCVVTTIKYEGVRGLYRGLLVNVVKVLPQAMTVFVSYEGIRAYLKQHAT